MEDKNPILLEATSGPAKEKTLNERLERLELMAQLMGCLIINLMGGPILETIEDRNAILSKFAEIQSELQIQSEQKERSE